MATARTRSGSRASNSDGFAPDNRACGATSHSISSHPDVGSPLETSYGPRSSANTSERPAQGVPAGSSCHDGRAAIHTPKTLSDGRFVLRATETSPNPELRIMYIMLSRALQRPASFRTPADGAPDHHQAPAPAFEGAADPITSSQPLTSSPPLHPAARPTSPPGARQSRPAHGMSPAQFTVTHHVNSPAGSDLIRRSAKPGPGCGP